MRTIYSSWLLDELVTRFGEGAVDRMIAGYASERLSVPKQPTQRLVEQLGQNVAEWLVSERGGQSVHVPPASRVKYKRQIAVRNREIQSSSESLATLAKKYDLSQRTISIIRAQAAPNL